MGLGNRIWECEIHGGVCDRINKSLLLGFLYIINFDLFSCNVEENLQAKHLNTY